MTSSILSPRRLFALCSPITQVIASATLLLPQPFGPTMAVTPLSKASSERSEKDLKPLISRRSRRMGTPRRDRPRPCTDAGYPSEHAGGGAVFLAGDRQSIDRSPARALKCGRPLGA